MGRLILAFSRQALWPRFYALALRVLWTTAAVLLLLLPIGWWIGWRIARPLNMLERFVAEIGGQTRLPVQSGAAAAKLTEQSELSERSKQALPCPPGQAYGELGRLSKRIERLGTEMRAKKALEAQVMRSERQAALGRMAAGIAHEVNNPLAGMLTAIAMYHRHGQDEQVTRHTLSLLERGLVQIRRTVSALLVEVRPDPGRFGPGDMDDIAELIAPQVRERRLDLDWDNRLLEELPLPAGAVRRILLNLALNAAQAAPRDSTVSAQAQVIDGRLQLSLSNAGAAIPLQRQALLFEPFASGRDDGSGLGLWLVDQQVRQLHGSIEVVSESGSTVFTVTLPLGDAHEPT